MMCRLFSVMLCLVLVVTSQSAGAARGAERAVGQMVICAGTGTVVIYAGADGAPTQVPHQCPDCTLHGLDILAQADPALGAVPVFAHHEGLAPVAVSGTPVPGHAQARAPPGLV